MPDSLLEKVKTRFLHLFKTDPVLVKSPGRVNLIGEHTDYNDGFVLPAAIEKSIVLAIAPNGTSMVNVFSMDMNESVRFDLSAKIQLSDMHWANYIIGAVKELETDGYQAKGFNCVFAGDIPIGAGLSSSAALEGGIITGLDALFDFGLSKIHKAKLGQRTEHNHVGVRCGIMDQFANLHGENEMVMKLDCRSLDYELYPFKRKDIHIVLCDSKVSHNLASSEYNIRRAQCEEGIELLKEYIPGIQNLRDVSLDLLTAHRDEMDPVVYRRCRYVVEENQRVLLACEDLTKGDFTSFGKRMLQSHNGLSNAYEVSCDELDILVELAKNHPGVFGSRMMGGGFGGCTINLVEEQLVDEFVETMTSQYKKKTGTDTEIYITTISSGTHIVNDQGEIK